MTRWGFVVATGAVSLLFVAGCGPRGGNNGASGSATGGNANVLRYPIPELTSIDPAMVQDGDSIDIVQNVFEGLVGWNEKSEVAPALAEKWTLSKDGRTYTFTLRDGIKFHNGRAVTADDFKFSIERATSPKLASPTAPTYLADIVGVREKIAGKAKEIAGYKVIDPKTIAITIDKPRPYFLGKLTYLTSAVVAKESVDPDKEFTAITSMVGTGPFKPTKYQPGQLFTMAANKEYWGGAPKLDGIERPTIKDSLTRLNKFKSGGLDLTRVERQDLDGLEKDAKFKDQVKKWPRASMYYFAMNAAAVPQFKDKRVRQAFAMAVDRKAIVEDILGGANEIAEGIIPPGCFGYDPNSKALPYDPAKARALLREAGVTPQSFGTLVLNHRDGQPDVRVVADKIASDIKSNLGIECKTGMMPWTAYLEKHNTKMMPFYHMRWGADYLDAENFLSTLLASYGAENKVNYKNPVYDALCAKADTMVGNDAERKRLYAEAQKIMLDDAPFVPLYFQRDAELISPRVQGLRVSLFGHLPHTHTSLN